MILVIVMSRHFRINPDNVATPIAASLGDLTTLTLLAMISNSVHDAVGKFCFVDGILVHQLKCKGGDDDMT